MKIDNQSILNGVKAYHREAAVLKHDSAEEQQTIPAQKDRVELASQKYGIEKLKKVVSALPDVRADKIAALKQQISAGTYHVDGTSVAEKMLGSHRFGGSE